MSDRIIHHAMKMPPEVAKAVIAVSRKIPKLAKDSRNEHGRYNYVSVDQFNEAVGALMAEAGLILVTQEIETEIIEATGSRGDIVKHLHARYELTLYAEGGESFGPIDRDITVVASGPQAWGSAQSYVEKYFMRSLFRVPTGEADADNNAPSPDLPATRGRGRQERPKAPPVELLSIEESATTLKMMQTALDMVEDRHQLLAWAQDHSGLKARLQPQDQEAIGKAFAEAQDILREAKASGLSVSHIRMVRAAAEAAVEQSSGPETDPLEA